MKLGSPIKPAFKKSGRFCFDNWMDKHCIKLRKLVSYFTGDEYDNYKRYESKNFEIWWRWYADQNYYWIMNKYDEFLYLLTFYKGRGRTDCILFQGTPIELDELKYLIKTLQKEKKEVK